MAAAVRAPSHTGRRVAAGGSQIARQAPSRLQFMHHSTEDMFEMAYGLSGMQTCLKLQLKDDSPPPPQGRYPSSGLACS
jgi:hypothetical protein